MTEVVPVKAIPVGRINAGMPELPAPRRVVSPFEFLPTAVAYTPVVLQSLLISFYHRDWALPLLANPAIRLSGMVGESKRDIFTAAGNKAQQWILPFVTVEKSGQDNVMITRQAKQLMVDEGLTFPVVGKPDMGCRGAGVKLLKDEQQLADYLTQFPPGGRFMLQQKSAYSAEAGLFYVRKPGRQHGQIISLTLKYSPFVIGDGRATLRTLIKRCPRASKLQHLYLPRHSQYLNTVIPDKVEFQLAFAGSHSRGCIFRNGNQFITDALTARLDDILSEFDGFHYGRLDVKFSDINSLMQGQEFDILEINGASSEAAHIWDSDTPLTEIFSTLMMQYRLLYKIGAMQKKKGLRTPTLRDLVSAWKAEKALTQHYPSAD